MFPDYENTQVFNRNLAAYSYRLQIELLMMGNTRTHGPPLKSNGRKAKTGRWQGNNPNHEDQINLSYDIKCSYHGESSV